MELLYKDSNGNISTSYTGQTIQVASIPTAAQALAGTIYQYTGTTTSSYTNGYFYKCVEGETTGTYGWIEVQVQEGGGSGQTIQVTTLPTASVDELGNIYQYIGTTGNGLVNGYFYKCVSDGESTPTYSWVAVKQPPTYPMWTGTVDEHTAAQTAGTIPNNSLVGITDNNGENITWYSRDDEGNETPFATGAVGAMIDDYHIATSTTWSSQKITNAITAGTPVMTGASATTDGAAGFAPAPTLADTQKALFGDGQYHTVYTAASGSTIIVQTNDSDLYGKTITLTTGSTTHTATMSNSGEAVFTNISYYGTATVSADDGNGNVARGSVNLTYFGNYVVGIGFNFSTINWETTNAQLAGRPLTVSIGNRDVATVTLTLVTGTVGTFRATQYVETLATYKINTLTAVGKARGTAVVSALKQTVTANVDIGEIYAFKIDKNDSNPATCVTDYQSEYGCDNLNYVPAHMDFTNDTFVMGSWTGQEFFWPKPCMLNYDGTVAYYLNPNNYAQRADGVTASDVADMTYPGNVMVEFPTIYFKRWEDNNYHYCVISDKQLDNDFHAWAHHDVNGDVLPFIYIAAYDGSYDGTRMRSMSGCGYNASLASGKIICQTTRAQEIAFAQACNDSGEQGEGWYTRHKADRDMINDLLLLIGMNTNTQTTFGNGCQEAGSQGCIGSGTMNDKGLFWGKNNVTSGVKIFGIENYWANKNDAVAGWIYVNGTQKIKMTYGKEDGSTVSGFNTDGTGYVTINESTITGTNGGYINNYLTSEYGLIPKSTGGSNSTFLSDGVWYSNGQNNYALANGDSDSNTRCGIAFVHLGALATRSAWHDGASLSYKPLAS